MANEFISTILDDISIDKIKSMDKLRVNVKNIVNSIPILYVSGIGTLQMV